MCSFEVDTGTEIKDSMSVKHCKHFFKGNRAKIARMVIRQGHGVEMAFMRRNVLHSSINLIKPEHDTFWRMGADN